MQKYFGSLRQLTIASIKMYFRDFTAIFFSLLFPVIFLLVFGFISTHDDLRLNVAYFNAQETAQSKQFDNVFSQLLRDEEADDQSINDGKVFVLDDDYQNIDEAKEALVDGDLHIVISIPDDFGKDSAGEVLSFIDESESEFGQTAAGIIESVLDGFNSQANIQATGAEPLKPYKVNVESLQSNDLSAIDYVIPGIIGFSIMSLGIFSIAQGFITYKSSGSLRRLFVTPVHPFSFLTAQTITRLLMVIINVVSMLLIAVLLFDFSMVGDVFNFILVSMIGAIMFLGIGFAIAGWAKNENQAAPLANIIFFPMMFLAGTFFPRELFPDWIQIWSEWLPLSFLTDALRLVANEGATLFSLGGEMLGMLAWTIVIYIIAVSVFRWE